MHLNPTLIDCNSHYKVLIRSETDVKNWLESILSYFLAIYSRSFTIRKMYRMTFQINANTFQSIKRSEIGPNNWCIEDIKVPPFRIGGKMMAIANVCMQNNPRIFRVCLLRLDLDRHLITYHKTLTVDNMMNDEKNWVLLKHNDKIYVIYSFFPLIIYVLNEDLSLTFHSKHETKAPNANNLNKLYKNLIMTGCSFPFCVKDNVYRVFLKKRNAKNIYEYYRATLNMDTFELKVDDKPLKKV